MSASPQRPNLPAPGLWLWRHPCPIGAAGRCIGQTDLPVPARRAKRLAHRIRHTARRESLPRAVWTSALRRCADVGRWLARWGWAHPIDARLLELDFGAWEGLPWAEVPRAALDEWAADPWGFAPPGGESGAALLARIQDFWRDFSARLSRDATTPLRRETATQLRRDAHQQPLVLISHGGPLRLLRQLAEGRAPDILEKPPALGAVLRFG